MVDAGVVVIRTAEQDHAEAVFALELIEHFPRGAAHGHVVEEVQGLVALFDSAFVFLGQRHQAAARSANGKRESVTPHAPLLHTPESQSPNRQRRFRRSAR